MNDAGPPTSQRERGGGRPRSGDGTGRGLSPAFAIAATIVTLLFLGVGIGLGYLFGIATTTSDGMGAAFGILIAVVWVAALAMLLVVGGGIALAFERTRPAGKILLMASAAVVVGAVSAAIAVPALGIRYEPSASTPPSLYATTNGTVSLTLVNEPEFVAGSELGGCSWVIDGGALSNVAALDAGTLRGRKLGAQVFRELDLGTGLIVFSVEEGFVNGMGPPTWTGTVPMTLTDSGHAGAVDFADLPIGPQKPGWPPDAAWPRTLTGTFAWTCD